MKEMKEMNTIICTVCPKGCRISVIKDESAAKGYAVKGSFCRRGDQYAIEETVDPKRTLTTTVKIASTHLRRLPVRTSEPIPKDKVMACMELINKVSLQAPIKMGDVVIPNILNTGSDIIATRNMDCI